MLLSMSPAAVCQCFTLVSLCTSIADPNWIQVRNRSDSGGKQLIYGVAFTLHAAQNLTDTGPLGGVNGWGMWLLYALAGLCYTAVLFCSASFLLDFLGTGLSRPRALVSLYVSTVVALLSILGVCGACMYIIYRNLQAAGRRFGDPRGRAGAWPPGAARPTTTKAAVGAGAGAAGLQVLPGDSFFIAVLGLLFSCAAAVICIRSPRGPVPPTPHRGYTAVVEVDEEEEDSGEGGAGDGERAARRQQGRGADWAEVFPE